MLKKLAIFALPFLVFSVQAYTQAHKGQKAFNGDKPTLPAPDVGRQQQSGPKLQAETDQHVNADVRVVILPPKDWQDKASFWITALLALVGGGTLIYLNKQVGEMKRQAGIMEGQLGEMKAASEVSREAVNAAYGSVTLGMAQLDLMKEKERARLDIDASRIEVSDPSEAWYLKAAIKLRNIGTSRAYITRSAGALTLKEADAALPDLDDLDFLSLPDHFLDPSNVPTEIERWFFSPEDRGKIEELAEDLLESRKSIHLYGFIEYETLGIRWRKDFGWIWNSYSRVSYFMVSATAPPETHERRVTSGYWRPDPEKEKAEYAIDREQPNNPN